MNVAVPAGFAPLSATFVSDLDGFVLGAAPCRGGSCTVLAATTDAGWSWHRQSGPPVPLAKLSGLRFATASAGFAYGPHILESTRDGGTTWLAVQYPGETAGAVLDQLAVSDGQVFVLTGVPSSDTVQASRHPLDSDTWAAVPGASLAAAPGSSAQLALGYGYGYLLSGATLAGGPLTGAWSAHPVPCPAGIDVSERTAVFEVHSFYLACSGQGAGGQYQKAAYFSLDGGATYHPTGYGPQTRPPAAGQLEFLAVSGGEAAFMATSWAAAGVYGLSGTTWKQVFGPIGDGQPVADFGFTDGAQGLTVLGDPNGAVGPGDGLYLTRDGGTTWTEVDFEVSSLPPMCAAGQLRLVEGNAAAALGNTATAFEIETTGAPCSLYGYPGVTLKSSTGAILAVALRAPSSYMVQARPEIPVVVSTASPTTFFLSDTDNPAGSHPCLQATNMSVFPPGSTSSLSAPVDYQFCAAPPSVSFVLPGRQHPGLGL